MASYNFMKAADRARCRADRMAEIEAVENGTWPRDIDDLLRWSNAPHLPPSENHLVRAEHAARMCRGEVIWIDYLETRITEGDPTLVGWEAPESRWVMFTKRTNDPKLAWLEQRLKDAGIPVRRNGESFHAPITEVPDEYLDDALTILGVIDDIPDDDPMWTEDPCGCSCSTDPCAFCLVREAIVTINKGGTP